MRGYSYNALEAHCNRNNGNATCPSADDNASYYWDDVSTKCTECSTNCTGCDYSTNNCTSCAANYTLTPNDTNPGVPFHNECLA